MNMESNAAAFLHYSAVTCAVALPTLGVAIGQGFAGSTALAAIDQQPDAKEALNKLFMIAVALTETAAILSTLLALFLLLGKNTTLPIALAHAGAAFAIALPATCIGFVSGFPVRNALKALARQPLIGPQITNLLLLSVSMAQTPVIFGFLIGLLIVQQAGTVTDLADGIRLFSSGLALAIGALGPSIGLAFFSSQACKGVGLNRQAYSRILSFTFISQAMVETPILFSLVISFILLYKTLPTPVSLFHGLICLVAAITAGLATFGVGISSGRTSGTACRSIAFNLDDYVSLSRTSILGQTLIDTNAIYGLIIALIMIMNFIS